MTENYFDGEWRPVTDHSFTALEKLRKRGFELGSDRYGKLMARWPIAPAAPYRTIIAGSRTITEWPIVESAIFDSGFEITEVVSGCARGVDALGEQWAKANGKPIKQFPADWKAHGKSAGYRRNMEMADYADQLIAVWDGTSAGTHHMIECANQKGLRVYVLDLSAPAAPLTFSGIPLVYWQEEVRLNCAVSLARLRRIVGERGADFDRTIAGLKGV